MSTIKSALKKILQSAGLVSAKAYKAQQDELKVWRNTLWTPGHYYSPYHDVHNIGSSTTGISTPVSDLEGIKFNETEQLELLHQLQKFYPEIDFPTNKSEKYRYYFHNDFFSYSDGVFLHSMMRQFKPKKILEIGSGYSSAMMLDTNERYLDNSVKLQFVEPYPEERLLNLIDKDDNSTVIKQFIQDVPSAKWKELESNDILFIDSSHVSKHHSDVNFLFFKVLPELQSGVIIHVHDIFYPFEYPAEWLKQGRAWTEAYLLRAFLQYNDQFEIMLFTSFLEQKHEQWFREKMPLCLVTHKTVNIDGKEAAINTTGQSIYLRKK